jgi:ketosteroid isomerase-like protein
MKGMLVSLLLPLVIHWPGHAVQHDAAAAIAIVDQRFDDALAKRDSAALAALLTDSFVWIHSLDGRVDSKTVFVEQTARGLGLSRQREESTTFEDARAIYPTTAVRTSRIRTRFKDGSRETWMRQNRVYVLDGNQWKLASGQGTRMYDGPVTTAKLYEPYAGTYVIDAKRSLRLAWDGDALLGTFPSGARTQVFLKSPTEEAAAGPDRFTFVLAPGGRPAAVLLMRGAEQVWRAERAPQLQPVTIAQRLDTPQVRVYTATLQPHAPVVSKNGHATHRALIYMDDGEMTIKDGDDTATITFKRGDVRWRPASGPYTAENIGDRPIRILEIDLKGPPAGPLPVTKLDPVAVDPQHYKVEFENEFVRVLRVRFGPGEKGARHEHILNRVVFYMNDQPNAKADDVRIAGAATHTEANDSDRPAERIAVEIK